MRIYYLYTIYIYTYFQVFGIRVLLSNPNTLGPQKGHCLSCSWLPHTRFFESSLPTLLVRHCQLMLNWWFVARWFGILGSPKLKSPHEIRAIWMFLQKQLLWPTPKKKHRAPKPPIYDFIVDQDLTKKKMDTFIPEPLGSSLGRKADLKNYHQVESLKKKPSRSSGTWISSPGRFTASCNKWAGIGSCARISSSPAFRGRFRFLGGGRDSKKWEKG